MRHDVRRMAAGLACGLAVMSCGGGDGVTGPPAADPGYVIATLSSTIPSLGAIQVLVPGASTDSFTVSSAFSGYSLGVGSSTRIIMYSATGPIQSGDVLQFWVPDRNGLASFVITREAAADRTTFAVHPGSVFSLTLRAAPKTGGFASSAFEGGTVLQR
jgi:hypothetical protein